MNTNLRKAVIAGANRTAIGAFNGSLAGVKATELGSIVIKEAVSRAGLTGDKIDEAIMGCVLSAGLGQAPARQAVIGAGLPKSVTCMTINKVCGSGLKAVMLASQSIATGDSDIVVAGGMENMSQTPYMLDKARNGYRLGHGTVIDSMINDGLWDVYNNFHMGNAAELCAREYNYSRESQDEFAINSYKKAQAAIANGLFSAEITPVPIPQRKGDPVMVTVDDEPGRANFEKMPSLRPAFDKDGTVTAANASKINDGAAAMIVLAEDVAKREGVKAQARIIAHASAAREPEWFTVAPVDAMKKALDRAGMRIDDIDLFEINEAFSVVTMVAIDQLGIPAEKVNINGGAVSLGHPIGASGARILTTLLYALEQQKKRFGLATLCIGGGEAAAMIVERI
ncbi:MAG: thiolase family protein [Deferribacteres bacterium]|nr:thiolase family protein [candidate division KSB1 bacterium]MCB9501183.1 thiolase family protein [Deferribacteres bacterium]